MEFFQPLRQPRRHQMPWPRMLGSAMVGVLWYQLCCDWLKLFTTSPPKWMVCINKLGETMEIPRSLDGMNMMHQTNSWRDMFFVVQGQVKAWNTRNGGSLTINGGCAGKVVTTSASFNQIQNCSPTQMLVTVSGSSPFLVGLMHG